MESKLNILHLEDESADSIIASTLLGHEGLPAQVDRVATLEDFRQALEHGAYDLILSDYSVPGLDPLEALRYAREHHPGLPFIFLSGTLREEQAIECLKLGATDYVLKHALAPDHPSGRCGS